MGRRLPNGWVFVLLFLISATRIGMGIYISITGPTLLYLAENVSSSVSAVSSIFSAKSVGFLVGSILGGVLSRYVDSKFRHVYVISVAICLLGVIELSIPWISHLWLLLIIVTAGGLMYGYLDAGMQALLLKLWGDQGSRSHIQLFHFMFCVGAFFAPLLAKPFLIMADEDKPSGRSCPNGIEMSIFNVTVSNTTAQADSEIFEETQNFHFNPVGWVYIIGSMFLLLISSFMFILGFLNIEDKVAKVVKTSGNKKEERQQEPFRDVIWVFIPLIGYYFCSVGTENVFYNYLYSVALCSDLKLSVSNSSLMNSVMWISLSLGRLIGIFASRYFEPSTIIIVSIVGSIVDSVIMCIFGEHTAWIAWLVAASHGITTSVMYPTGVSWLSQITNVSGTYMFIFSVGNSLSSFTMLPLAGFLFDINPFNVMYLVFALAVLNAVCYGLCLYTGKMHLKKFEKNQIQNEAEIHTRMNVQEKYGKYNKEKDEQEVKV